jgi:hypothetical protein
MKHFTAWQAHTGKLTEMIRNSGQPQDAEIWRYPDGSFAIGYITDFDDTDDDAISEGTVTDWLADMDSREIY